jgi:hypothetical protein
MHARRRVRITQHYALVLVLAIALLAVASDAASARSNRRVTGGTPAAGGTSEAAGTALGSGTSAVLSPAVDIRGTNTLPEIGSVGALGSLGGLGGLTTPTTAATPPQSCVRSYNPACGPLRWVPAPVNRPLTVSFFYSPSHPQPGDLVTFTVVLDDPDDANLQIQQAYYGMEPGAITPQVGAVGASPVGRGCQTPYGTWPPPPPGPHGHTSKQLTYTYTSPGTYQVHFVATSGQSSGSCATPDPYASTGQSIVQNLTVDAPPPPPTTTTSTTQPPPPPDTTTTIAPAGLS